ncbi:MAG: DnaB-like helicase C-terminal domain-containing protein [Phycisphaerales bacterium]|nr:DnaB-like helicase C-terminal domain-containing protein [Phycisphaerales bacterium]
MAEARAQVKSLRAIGTAADYNDGVPAISTGFDALDRALKGGFRPEGLYLIAGRTGSAKSTLAANIARRVGLNGDGVLFFKLEESPRELTWRIHAASAKVNLDVLMNGRSTATPEDSARLDDAWETIQDLPIDVSDLRGMDDIEGVARMARMESRTKLVVIDQASMVAIPETSIGFERMSQVSERLRLLARETKYPIVVVCQINRTASKQTDRLTCNDLRDSGTLENDAAGVILIDRSDRDPGSNIYHDPLILKLLIGKHRYGPTTRDDDPYLELSWYPESCRIEDRAATPGGWEQ